MVAYARFLGIAPEEDAALLHIAREGLEAPLPDGWKPCRNEEGNIYYFHMRTGDSVWQHPNDEFFKRKVEEHRRTPGPGPAAAAKAEAAPPKPALKPLTPLATTRAADVEEPTTPDLLGPGRPVLANVANTLERAGKAAGQKPVLSPIKRDPPTPAAVAAPGAPGAAARGKAPNSADARPRPKKKKKSKLRGHLQSALVAAESIDDGLLAQASLASSVSSELDFDDVMDKELSPPAALWDTAKDWPCSPEQTITRELESVQAEFKKLQGENKDMAQQVQDLAGQKDGLRKQVEALRKGEERVQAQLDKAKGELRAAAEQAARAGAENQALAAENERLKKELAARPEAEPAPALIDAEMAQIKMEYEYNEVAMQAEVERLQSERLSLTEANEHLKGKLQVAEREYDEYRSYAQREMRTANAEIEAFGKDRASFDKEKGKLVQENEAVKMKLKVAMKKLKEGGAQVQQLHGALQRGAEKDRSVQAEKDALQTRVDLVQRGTLQNLDSFSACIEELVKATRAKEEDLAARMGDLESEKRYKVEDFAKQLSSLDSDIRRLGQDIAACQSTSTHEVSELRQEVFSTQREAHQAKLDAEEADHRAKRAAEDLERSQSLLREERLQMDTIKGHVRQKEEAMAKKCEDLAAELSEAKVDAAAARARLAGTEAELEGAEKRAAELEKSMGGQASLLLEASIATGAPSFQPSPVPGRGSRPHPLEAWASEGSFTPRGAAADDASKGAGDKKRRSSTRRRRKREAERYREKAALVARLQELGGIIGREEAVLRESREIRREHVLAEVRSELSSFASQLLMDHSPEPLHLMAPSPRNLSTASEPRPPTEARFDKPAPRRAHSLSMSLPISASQLSEDYGAPPAPVPSESPRLSHARQGSPKYVLHTVEEGKVHGKAEEPPAAQAARQLGRASAALADCLSSLDSSLLASASHKAKGDLHLRYLGGALSASSSPGSRSLTSGLASPKPRSSQVFGAREESNYRRTLATAESLALRSISPPALHCE